MTTNIQPATVVKATATIGSTVDADIADIKARIATLEADASADFSKAEAWVKANWPHFITWAGTAFAAVKLGLLKLL